MTDGNTYAINQHLNDREDWDELQEVTAELEQAEAKVEELETKLEDYKRLMLTLAGDKIDLVSQLAGIKFKLAKAVEALECLIQHTHNCERELTERLHHLDFCGESEPLTKARTTLAELKGDTE